MTGFGFGLLTRGACVTASRSVTALESASPGRAIEDLAVLRLVLGFFGVLALAF